jgi:hypothetical protein
MFLSVSGYKEGTYTIKRECESQALIIEWLARLLKEHLFLVILKSFQGTDGRLVSGFILLFKRPLVIKKIEKKQIVT